MSKVLVILFFVCLILGCNNFDDENLPSFDDRTRVAIDDLRQELVSVSNGWRLDYSPSSETGTFVVFLNFMEDGTVRIQSDISAQNGELQDQIVSYRIDSSQGLELIFETYSIFHFLFELQRATFGGEFEFVFSQKSEDNLIFRSKTDNIFGEVTIATLTPAGANEDNLISTAIENSLRQGIFQTENLAGISSFSTFNIYMPADDITISTTFDINGRRMKFHGAASGRTMTDIISRNENVNIDRLIGYRYENETIILDSEVSVSVGGTSYSISQIPVGGSSALSEEFCAGQTYDLVRYTSSSTPNLGDIEITSSLFQTQSNFRSGTDVFFSIDFPLFVYNESDEILTEQIQSIFPDVAALQWYYGFELAEDSLLNAVGFVTLDETNNAKFYLRGFDYTQNGNHISLTFNGENFITDDEVTEQQIAGLEALTDEIFAGGEVFILEALPIEGLFEYYNPCNRYKGFVN
ncbi:DUF4302 domain-containing protein [Ekhidna sp.]